MTQVKKEGKMSLLPLSVLQNVCRTDQQVNSEVNVEYVNVDLIHGTW